MNRGKRITLISILLILTATLVFTGACLDFSSPLGKVNLAFDSELILDSSAYAYTGEEIKPAVTLKHRDEIVDQDNYTLTYSDNVQPGKAKVTATGKGNYYGEVSASFDIGYLYTFDINGANNVQGEIEQSVLSKEDLIPPIVEKTGYDFSHWSIDSQPVDFSDKSNLPIGGEFVANYTLKTYSINYNLNGGVNHSDNRDEYTVEDIFVLKDASLRGMQFAGWYKDSEFKHRLIDLNGCAGNLELYAKFVDYTAKRLSYVVPDDAIKLPSDLLYPETQLTTPNSQIKEINGAVKKLVWYADPEYQVRYYFREMPNEDITVYAQWEDTLR
ncbi:MAG: InlB B-repeat-containing protein, partial [Clostridia bacterium]|nr:InlB B-repeat-containing protein [Clostridia bacterium]